MDFGSPFWGVTIDFLRLEHGGFVFKIPYRYQCPSIYIPKHFAVSIPFSNITGEFIPPIFAYIFAGVHLVRV